jgi:hypothetical protein
MLSHRAASLLISSEEADSLLGRHKSSLKIAASTPGSFCPSNKKDALPICPYVRKSAEGRMVARWLSIGIRCGEWIIGPILEQHSLRTACRFSKQPHQLRNRELSESWPKGLPPGCTYTEKAEEGGITLKGRGIVDLGKRTNHALR